MNSLWGWIWNTFQDLRWSRTMRQEQIKEEQLKEYRKRNKIPDAYIKTGSRSNKKQQTMHSHRRK